MSASPSPPKAAAPVAPHPCDLAYIAQAEDEAGMVKVGQSADPTARLAGLRAGVPFPLRLVAILSNGKRREREMKELLAANRLRGEWFRPSHLLNEYLRKSAEEGALVQKHTIDADYVHAHVVPLVTGYLEGKQRILYNEYGNFVYRFLRESYEAFKADKFRLLVGCSGAVSAGNPTWISAEPDWNQGSANRRAFPNRGKRHSSTRE